MKVCEAIKLIDEFQAFALVDAKNGRKVYDSINGKSYQKYAQGEVVPGGLFADIVLRRSSTGEVLKFQPCISIHFLAGGE